MATSDLERRCRAVPWVLRHAVWSRVDANGQPIGREAQARAQDGNVFRDSPQRHDDTRRAGREGQLYLVWPIHAAGQLEWHSHLARDALDRFCVGRRAPLRAIEIDQMQHL